MFPIWELPSGSRYREAEGHIKRSLRRKVRPGVMRPQGQTRISGALESRRAAQGTARACEVAAANRGAPPAMRDVVARELTPR